MYIAQNKAQSPSEYGRDFTEESKVTFKVNGSMQTGTIRKQLVNSAVVSIDETVKNKTIIFNTNGIMVVSYEKLTLV